MEGRALKVSLVLVTHRSAAVLPAALASSRAAARHAGVELEVVVVDNSEDAAEAAAVAAARPDRLLQVPNQGYAAGLNRGMAVAQGEVLVLGNPDIEMERGALAALLAALDGGWDVVGPQFLLGEFLFPPADEQRPQEELRRWLALRSAPARSSFLQAEAERWMAAWTAAAPLAVPTLSGALLAVHAETARRIGPWDESYFLYFEETEWLARGRRMEMRYGLVPGARVSHGWGHSGSPERRDQWFAESRRRFYEEGFGETGRWALELPGAPSPPPRPALPETLPQSPSRWWLVSPSPWGFPAAGAPLEAPKVRAALAAFVDASPHCPNPSVLAFDPARHRLEGPWELAGS